MTFSAYEQSNDDGKPVGLYLFSWGNTQWGYNTAERTIVHDGISYEPLPIKEKAFVQAPGRDPEFSVTVPSDTPVVSLFRGTPPSEPVVLIVRRIHFSEAEPESKIVWVAPISNVLNEDQSVSEIVSRHQGLRKGGLRLAWSRACPHFLYGTGCKVLKSLYAVSRTITDITGNVVTVDLSSPSAAYFDGGFIEWDADGMGTLERRTIEVETADKEYLLFGRSDGLTVGQSLTFYPGCNHTMEMCIERFDNQANHGGVKFMPGTSPFDGQALI